VAANDGNIHGTAAQLDLPAQTVRQWATGERCPEVAQQSSQAKAALADAFEQLARRLLGIVSDKLKDMSPHQAMIAAAVAVDKMLLLRGQLPPERPAATVNVNVIPDRINSLAAAFASAAERQAAADRSPPTQSPFPPVHQPPFPPAHPGQPVAPPPRTG
jgi:hypothetical protein